MKLAAAVRYWETVRHLRPQQVLGRILYRLHRPRPDMSPAPHLRQVTTSPVPWIAKTPAFVDAQTITLLNLRADVSAASIWQDRSRPLLWLYNLHYFDDLAAAGAHDRRDWQRSLIERWIRENPPLEGVGWDPYPSSLRIVNLIKWHLSVAALSPAALHSLAVQVRHLRRRLEYHILGNHLVANAKALFIAGSLFGGEEADSWRRLGARLLAQQLKEQVLADGAHFELSPMYHLIVLEDVLDVINVGRAFAMELPENIEGVAAAMLAWAAHMQHPDGDIPFFNDATFGIAPQPAVVSAYARSLNINSMGPPSSRDTMSASGYVRLRRGEAVLIADVAPVGPSYLPGHAHADTLSFEFSLKRDRIVVNGGTSVYGTGAERQRQRSTAAHSTLSINGLNSSDVWAGFRVGGRATVGERHLECNAGAVTLAASHDGYRHHAGACQHARQWELTETRLIVTDRVVGTGQHRLECLFHLHPAVKAEVKERGIVLTTASGRNLRVETRPHVSSIVPTTWHPGFGLSIPTHAIAVCITSKLPATIQTAFTWDVEKTPCVS